MNEQNQQTLEEVKPVTDVEAPVIEEQPKVDADGKPIEGKKPEEKKPEAPKENHDSRRWRRLLIEKGAAEKEVEMLREMMERGVNIQPASDGDKLTRPTRDQFPGDNEKYMEALTDYQEKLAEKIERVKNTPATPAHRLEETEEAARKEYADYDDVIEEQSDLPVNRVTADTIQTGENGAALRYYLAKNPEQARKLAKLSEKDTLREIGKIEARIEMERAAAKKPAPKGKEPPTPINPERNGGGAPSGEVTAHDLFKQYSKRP